MDLKLKNKFLVGLFALALVTLSACSSGQVDETGAPLESAGETVNEDGTIATTDEAPAEDLALDNPAATDPNAPPADAEMASTEPVNLDTAPVEAPAEAPLADQNLAPMDTAPVAEAAPAIADAPPATNTTTEIPVDTAMVSSDPAPVADNSMDAAPMEEPTTKKKKRKKKGGAEYMAQASGDGMHYSVRQGDTLMKIAFENYGDLYRWREIYEANRDKIQDPNHVPPGTQLVLNGAGMVTIERNGEQYLIQSGDTLGSISHNVYGTPRKWKRLWENNRQLIKDPNKIYAGFYLYYQPDGKLTHDNGMNGMEGAQNVPSQAPVQQVVQEAKAPVQQNVAQAPAAPAGVENRAPASAAPTQK